MRADNLYHRRKRSLGSLKRKITPRESYDLVLIVCEGKKTEPNYLLGLRDHFQLNSANIKVLGVGADPMTIVNNALDQYNKTKDYNRVYCVFDKDNHSSYSAALERINHYRNRNENPIPIYAITSVPCFEFWLLLHYTDTSSPYISTAKKSAGQQLIRDIQTYIPGYKKGQKDIFSITRDYLNKALIRAKRIDQQQEKNGTDNPSTKVYLLVNYLQQIKNNK